MDPISLEQANQDFQPLPMGPNGVPRITVTKQEPIPIDDLDKHFKEKHDDKKPVPVDSIVKMNSETENQMLGSSQGVSPDVTAHKKNYVGDATADEEGNIGYKDDDGKFHATDSNKHVVLHDPDDNKYKVYNRADDTSSAYTTNHMFGIDPKGVVGNVINRAVGLGRFVTQGFATGAPEVAAASSDVLGAAARQGVQLPKAVGTPDTGTTLSRIPIVGRPIGKAANQSLGQIEHAADAAARQPTGDIVNPQQAGQTAREAITNYAAPKINGPPGVLAGRVDKAYNDVKNSFTNPTATHDLPNTRTYAKGLVKQYQDAGLATPKSLDTVLGPLQKPGGLDYDSIKLVRTKVGQMIDNPHLLPPDVSGNELKALYGSLSEDLKEVVVKAGGTNALGKFNRANTYNKLVNERRATLQKILGPDSRTDEGLFGTIQRMAGSTNSADAKALAAARKAVPPAEWNDIAAASVNRLGSRVSKAGESWSAGDFAKGYGNLSETGKNILFGEKGFSELRQSLDDIQKLSTHVAPTLERMAHPAGYMHTGLGIYGVVEGIDALRGLIEGGSLARAGSTAAAAVGAGVMSHWLSNPIKARTAARWLGAWKDYKLARTVPGAKTSVGRVPYAQAVANYNNATKAVEALKKDFYGE